MKVLEIISILLGSGGLFLLLLSLLTGAILCFLIMGIIELFITKEKKEMMK